MSAEDNTAHKPDGGLRAWTVVIASFLIILILVTLHTVLLLLSMKLLKDGIMFSFGVFLSHLLSYFSSGRAETTAILSVMTFTTCGSGPLAAIAIKTLGYRKVLNTITKIEDNSIPQEPFN